MKTNNKKILVTGGAGYVGSHVVKALRDAGKSPVVFDNLSTGLRENLLPDIPFLQGDTLFYEQLKQVLHLVMHQKETDQAIPHLLHDTCAGCSCPYKGRYDWAEKVTETCLESSRVAVGRKTDRIDRILTHPVAGIAGFFAIMVGVFYLIFSLASVPMDLVDAGFDKVKINTVLMRGKNEDELLDLVNFSYQKNLLLRFIEMMPVSTNDVLKDSNFLPCGEVMKFLSDTFGGLEPSANYRTNGPATYYKISGRDQLIGFIGAMTNLHFCESCNKLRLTCDGKLRPCLGSHLEFDLLSEIRSGASDERIADFIREVVARKPKAHDFLSNYQPGRKMIAIGG